MPYRCAILDDYQNLAIESADWSPIAKDVEVKVFNAPLGGQDKVIQALADFDFVVGIRERTPFPRAVIEALPKLKLLITTGARNASFDTEAAKERNVVVSGTPGVGNPTAGVTIGLMLELTRHIGYENARMKSGHSWQTTMGNDLEGQTLGVIGLGKLGVRVANIAKAFGMKVLAWSQNLTPEKCQEAGVVYASKDDLLRQSDFVSIHVVLSQRSRGLIGAARDRPDEADRLPDQHLARTDRRRGRDDRGAHGEAHRRRRARRVRRRAAAARFPAAAPRQRRTHAASRLRVDPELQGLFRRGRGGHPRLPRWQAGARPQLDTPSHSITSSASASNLVGDFDAERLRSWR